MARMNADNDISKMSKALRLMAKPCDCSSKKNLLLNDNEFIIEGFQK